MSVMTDLVSVLEPLVGSRVYEATDVPDDMRQSYITYQQLGGRAVFFLERALVPKKNGRFQINWWAPTKAEVDALATQIGSAIVLSTLFQASAIEEPVDADGSLVNLFGQQQDFGIWSDR